MEDTLPNMAALINAASKDGRASNTDVVQTAYERYFSINSGG